MDIADAKLYIICKSVLINQFFKTKKKSELNSDKFLCIGAEQRCLFLIQHDCLRFSV